MRFRTIEYGLKKLEKTEKKLEKILAKRARRLNRYVKKCPGEMVHTDSSVLPLISESRAKNWIDDARRLMKFCERARYEFENGSQDRRRQIVAAIGTEHILKD